MAREKASTVLRERGSPEVEMPQGIANDKGNARGRPGTADYARAIFTVIFVVLYYVLVLLGWVFSALASCALSYQVMFWLKYGDWLPLDLLRFWNWIGDWVPYSSWVGIDRIIFWFLEIPLTISLILLGFVCILLGIFCRIIEKSYVLCFVHRERQS